MRWLFRPGSQPDDAPKIMTIHDTLGIEEASSGAPVHFLPDGGLRANVSNAAEARDALLALQRRQRELLTSATRGAGSGVAAVGGTLVGGVTGDGRKVRHVSNRVVRRFRFRSAERSGSATTSNSMLDSESIDALLLLPHLADGAIGTIKLIGAAAQAIAEAMPDIDMSDFDFLDLLDF